MSEAINKSAPTVADWARLAAFIDGEGCISIKRCHQTRSKTLHRHTLRVDVANTDVRLVVWIRNTFGIGGLWKRNRADWTKTLHFWEVTSKKAVQILEGCYPYFIIKREQADIALAFQQTMKFRGIGRGNLLSPEMVEVREQMKAKLSQLKKVEYIDKVGA